MKTGSARFERALPWLLGAWPIASLGAEAVGPGTGTAIFTILGLHYAVAGILIAGFFLSKLSRPVRAHRSKGLFMLLVLLLWALCVTLLNAQNLVVGIAKLGELSAFVILGIATASFSRGAGEEVFLKAFRALAAGLIAALILSMAADVGFRDVFENRRVPGFVHIRILGFSATIAIAITTAWLVRAEEQQQRWLPALLLCLGWTVLFWSASRGGVLAFIATFAILGAFLAPLRRNWGPWLAALVTGFGLSYLVPGLGDTGTQTMFDHDLTVDGLSTGRWTLWEQTLGFVAAQPLIGHGYGQFHTLAVSAGGLPETVMPHSHNVILESALAIGWPATAVLGGLVIWSWIKWACNVRRDTSEAGLASLLVVSTLLIYALVDGVYFYPESALAFALAAGVLSASSARHQLKRRMTRP